MIIESIKLYNFRQYFNDQTIEFSQSTTRNVTVIHGENGSGKTALLNAFSWGLYGILNLPNKENIINEHAVEIADVGERVECYVEIKFIDNKIPYTLRRTIAGQKRENGTVLLLEPELSIEHKVGGQSDFVNNPQVTIDRILPQDLRTYFFFDGERIDNLSKESGAEDIKKAIKNIMGLEILERGIQHTAAARKKIRSELKQFGDAKTNDLLEKIDRKEKQQKELQKEEEELKDNLRAINKQIESVEGRLKTVEGAKKLQEERDAKTAQLNEVKDQLKQIQKQLLSVMSKNGYLAFTSFAVDKADTILKNNQNKATVSGIKSSFIDELLKRGTCICGEKLAEHSSHIEHLETLKSLLDENKLDHLIVNLSGDFRIIKERKKNLFEKLKELKASEVKLRQQQKKLEEEIDEVSDRLTGKNSEEIVELEQKRKNLIVQKSDFDRKVGSVQIRIDEFEKELKKLNDEQKKIEQINEKAILTQKRTDVCTVLEDKMVQILKFRETLVKEQLQDRITNVYEQFLRKNYQIKLTEHYDLNVLNEKGNPVGMSQGERQITSLSFIGAIVDIARDQYKKENKQGFEEGGIYPLVMDSPFGALDSDHRERVAKGIHKLADQVIVIVSTSQWRGEVEGQMANLIGKEYRLRYNDPRQNKDKPYEFTDVEEVK